MPASPFTRLLQSSDSLDVILKNTHFSENLLNSDASVSFHINFDTDLPVLVFKFSQPYYDFLEILKYTFDDGFQNWAKKDPIVVKLILSDSIVADRLTTKSFSLDFEKSEMLRNHLLKQKHLTNKQIADIEQEICHQANRFLM